MGQGRQPVWNGCDVPREGKRGFARDRPKVPSHRIPLERAQREEFFRATCTSVGSGVRL